MKDYESRRHTGFHDSSLIIYYCVLTSLTGFVVASVVTSVEVRSYVTAYNLYNGYEDNFTSPHDLFRTLDSSNYLIAKGAIDEVWKGY